MPLRRTAYTSPAALPERFVGSVRCLVRVGDRLVCCQNVDGSHPWPGGRREPGESFRQTAIREVREETGWLLEPDSVTAVGWLHLEHLAPLPYHHPYPHPDFLQLVVRATATDRDARHRGDTDGFEDRHWLAKADAVAAIPQMDPLAEVFLERANTA